MAAFGRESEEGGLNTGFDIEGYRCDSQTGAAGWSDFSDCSQLAREALTEAAGITVPERDFILYSLGLYLLALVPINWIVFKLMGRVEWAWAAVPLIALAGTYAVVKLAQLDIGFARSRTEMAVMETQPGYTKGHLTRYIGLYTSLSTNYELSFSDETAVALPFATGATLNEVSQMPSQNVFIERADRGDDRVHFGGLAVASNSTGMIHTEQMIDLGGEVRLDERSSGSVQVSNLSRFHLRDVGLLRRKNRRLELAWVGLLKSGATGRLNFTRVEEDQVEAKWEQFGAIRTDDLTVDFRQFLRLATVPSRINEGDVRLIGWSEVEMPGLSIKASCEPTSLSNAMGSEPQVWPAADSGVGPQCFHGFSTMIELIDFGKEYGDFTAVGQLNLKIDAGEMFGFIGPNGAGKSTTIRFLTTLLKATRGEGRVNGHSVTDAPMDVRRSVGYMPDTFGVYDGLKVWEFLDFFAVAYGIPRGRRRQVIGGRAGIARSFS